jgi:flagellum-specific peptidoglycan hydrolase FlgJ
MAMNPMAGMGRPPAMGGMPPSMGVAPMGQAPTAQGNSGIMPSVQSIKTLTETLRYMPEAELQQYAAMHRNDPFVFPLAFQVSQARQKMRTGQAAQMAGQKPPPVVDQDLAQMAPQTLPEEQGIGALNAPNLQNMADGGIAGYADGGQQPGMFNYAQMAPAVDLHPNSGVTPRSMAAGGIAHFASKGAVQEDPKQTFATQYRNLATQVGQELGVDPGILIAQWGHESAWGKKPVGQYNFGNIKDVTGKGVKAYDKAEKSRSAYKGYETPEEFGKDYVSLIKNNFPKAVGAGSDVGVFTAGLQNGVKGSYATDPNYRQKIAATFNKLPLGTAVAAAPLSDVNQIPGQAPSVKAPPSNYDQTNTYFGGLADRLGIPQEYQRNISNTLNALGGYSSPVSSVGRGVGMASKALEPTAEMIAKAEQAKNAVALPRIAAPAKVIEGLTPEAQAMRDAAIQARQVRALEADKQAALGAEQSVNAATQTSDIARKMEESIANARRVGATAKIPGTEKAITLGGRLNEAKMSGAAQGLAAMNDAEKAIQGSGISSFAPATAYPNYNATTEAEDASFGPRTPLKGTETIPSTDEIAKTVTGEKKGRNWDDIMLNTGLGLLAGKSPHALQNLGEAGLNALQIERAQTKEDREQKLAELHGKYYESAGKQAEANANYIADERSNTALMQKAAGVTEQYLKAWMDSQANTGVAVSPEEAMNMRTKIYKQTLGMMGLQIPSTMASSGMNSSMFKLIGSRPDQ